MGCFLTSPIIFMIATGFRVPLLSLSDNYDLLSSDDAAVATERLDLAVNL